MNHQIFTPRHSIKILLAATFFISLQCVIAAETEGAVTVLNRGFPGQNSREGLARLPKVLTENPDHLVLFFGMNDAINSNKLVDLKEYRKSLKAMVEAANRAKVKSVVLVTIHPIDPVYVAPRHPRHPQRERLQEHLAEYDAVVRDVAKETGALLADWRARFLAESPGDTVEEAVADHKECLNLCVANSGTRNGNHPTADGYRFLADECARVLRKRVKAGETIVCFGDSLTYGSHMKGEGTATGETYPSFLFAAMSHGAPTDEDVQDMVKQFKTRLKTSIIEENQIIYDASESVKTMQPDGSWPGIDYGSKAMHNWPGNEHLYRMVDMSGAYVADPKHPLYKNDDLLEKILRSIDFWFARNPTEGHPNWWYRDMQPQMSLSKVCLLMDPYLGKERRAKMVGILQSDVHSRHTGANLVWFAENTFIKGMFLEDYAMMQHAVAALNRAYTPAYKTLHEVALEGLQPDSSFTQHGMHFYNNMYGLGYFMSSCRWLYVLHDSPLAFSNATRNLINDMALNGNRWMLRYHQNDPSSRGRAIATRVPERGSASSLLHPLELLKKANDDPETKSQIQHFIDHINGKRPTPGVVGNRYFWRVDYMSHIREKFFASVRMVSKGVKGSEETIGNNVLGGLTSYGLTFIMRTGREYDHIFPVWDWALLPGVSAPRETFRPNHLSHMDSTFVGGVTDGTYGCAAMDFAKKILKINKSFGGKKAYFFFDDEIVALGTALASDSNNEFNTTLNQCLLTDQVYIDGQAKGLEASPVAKQYEGRWVNHDSIGYVFPEKQTFMLKNGEQSGSWKRISTNLSDAPVKHSVFTLYLEHGIKPKNGSYEYIVVPGITSEETAAYSEEMPVRILKNSHHIQAVEHVPLKTAGVVFHKPGQISLTSGLTVSADHQCFVLIRENPDGSFGVSAANPETPGLKLTITLKNEGNQKSVVYRFEEGIAFLGRSITKRVVLSQLEADN